MVYHALGIGPGMINFQGVRKVLVFALSLNAFSLCGETLRAREWTNCNFRYMPASPVNRDCIQVTDHWYEDADGILAVKFKDGKMINCRYSGAQEGCEKEFIDLELQSNNVLYLWKHSGKTCGSDGCSLNYRSMHLCPSSEKVSNSQYCTGQGWKYRHFSSGF